MTRPWDPDVAMARITAHEHMQGALLPMLHALQEEFGYIDDACVPLLADTLNISKAEVVGVIHFYHDFRHSPPGKHILRICRAEACQSMGCESLVKHIGNRLDIEIGAGSAEGAFTSLDGSFSIENVFCLGNCALSPALMIDGRLYGRVSTDRVDQLLGETRAAT